MVGGGSRRDEGSRVINNTNVFAALENLRKKKKSDKDSGSSKTGKGSKSQQQQNNKAPEKPQVLWAPAPLTVKSWADVDDDDDDYYATTAPLQSGWGLSEAPHSQEENPTDVVDSESEEDILDEGDDDVEDEHDHEPEVAVHQEPVMKMPPKVSAEPKEAERQLSKKERKKKELAELEALLADFGVAPKESNGQDESRDIAQEKKGGEPNGEGEKKEIAPGESKNAKKKKKKDKSKEVKEPRDQPNDSNVANGPDKAAVTQQVEEDVSNVDVKEKLKKVASSKKKKSGKEMNGAAKAAAQEAAARNARIAAAKKKEKNHYNQQPVR